MVDAIGGSTLPQIIHPRESGNDVNQLKVSIPSSEENITNDSEQKVNKEQLQQSIEKINKTMDTYSTELHFEMHEKSGEYMVKVINSKDRSVIREIPPERVLNMVAYFKEMLGILVDKFA